MGFLDDTQQSSRGMLEFFDKLESPGNASVTDFINEVEADRSAMDSYRGRVEDLGAPGDMKRAQANLELVYELRASAMDEIAEKMPTALGDAGAEKAMAGIAKQMQKLLASDIVYETVVRPEVDGVLREAFPMRPSPRMMSGRAILSRDVVQVEDALGAVVPVPADDPVHVVAQRPVHQCQREDQ